MASPARQKRRDWKEAPSAAPGLASRRGVSGRSGKRRRSETLKTRRQLRVLLLLYDRIGEFTIPHSVEHSMYTHSIVEPVYEWKLSAKIT